ncbi:hypothetical protein E2C01_056840 [Portunus trituberculatus]|uniref:Uncharacterized protein n=1 Tax=Portunus trituberculatus TaxID=210409 RepID=A0A5B7GRX1_PORTR|nr:hypothetical protein [Portunus trituberculatus]
MTYTEKESSPSYDDFALHPPYQATLPKTITAKSKMMYSRSKGEKKTMRRPRMFKEQVVISFLRRPISQALYGFLFFLSCRSKLSLGIKP